MSKPINAPISLPELAVLYFKTGASAFGGWPTTSLLLERALVDERKILTKRQLHSASAAGQLLPGAAQVILAVQVVYFMRGVRGAIIGAVVYLAPSITITLLFSFLYFAYFKGSDFTNYTLGLQAAVGGIIIGNAYRIGNSHLQNKWLLAIVALAFGAKFGLGVPVIVILLAAALFGIFIFPLIRIKTRA